MTLQAAIELTNLARKKASTLGKDISVAVVDAEGQTIIISRGDGVGIHNTEAARRKAFTAASTKTATLTLSRNAKANPDTENLANLPELLLLGGGIPLLHQGKVIGAIGIAGGGSPEHDDLIGRSVSIPHANIIAK
ncbi:heme-binding protein [Pedobacter jejuensis]|uniref:Heme-binding protein n=2 Tax=Pedobacter jejuensis TaxID=1268550 RepID=A0A3N0C274_9SPHI|nr:heme-binding protein [Pedobacter jejuensis]